MSETTDLLSELIGEVRRIYEEFNSLNNRWSFATKILDSLSNMESTLSHIDSRLSSIDSSLDGIYQKIESLER